MVEVDTSVDTCLTNDVDTGTALVGWEGFVHPPRTNAETLNAERVGMPTWASSNDGTAEVLIETGKMRVLVLLELGLNCGTDCACVVSELLQTMIFGEQTSGSCGFYCWLFTNCFIQGKTKKFPTCLL